MREVHPFSSADEAMEAIDNGGRFYHLFAKPHDNVVSRGELAKAAGVIASDRTALLFLDVAIHELSGPDKNSVISSLALSLRDEYDEKRPFHLAPHEVDAKGEAGHTAVVEGRLHQLDDATAFKGMVSMPMQVGTVTTYHFVPIYDHFEVFELVAPDENARGSALVAVTKGSDEFRPDEPLRIGGYLRDLHFEADAERTHDFYLDAVYFTHVR